MNNLRDLKGIVIPCVEEEYLKTLKFNRIFPSLINKNDRKGADFIRIAEYFYQDGFKVLQVITENYLIIKNIKKRCRDAKIVGGGNIESVKTAAEFLNNQSDYFIIGRLFAKTPNLIKSWVKLFGRRLIVSVDDRNGSLANNKNINTTDFSMLLANNKVKNVIYVSENTKLIGGVNLSGFEKVRSIIKNSIVIYSGGVSSLGDIRVLKNAGADSIIVGTALYNKGINYSDAKKVFNS
ncbi:MAG: HisA/HisF-related TIM barrel protein [Patescibacteria group bacterium]